MSTLGKKCGLLSLPAEIRNKVWREVFNDSCVILSGSDSDTSIAGQFDTFHPEVLRTCKAINYEARPLLASSTSITLDNCDSSGIRSTTVAYYFHLVQELTFTERIKEPLIVDKFPALRVLTLCSLCLTTLAWLSVDCPDEKLYSYIDGRRDQALIQRTIQILETNVRNVWLQRLLDKNNRRFGIHLFTTFWTSTSEKRAEEAVRFSFDLDTRTVLMRWSWRPNLPLTKIWRAGTVSTYKYKPGPGSPLYALEHKVSEAPWLPTSKFEDFDTYIAEDFEDWHIEGHYLEDGGHDSMEVD